MSTAEQKRRARSAVPADVRRRLRIGLGSRTQRRAGTKNRRPVQPLPKAQLRKAIERWLREEGGCRMTPRAAIDPIVLALDLGQRTGHACSDGRSGVADFRRHEGHGHLGWRFASWLGDMLCETGAAVVVIERSVSNPRFAGFEGQRVGLGLRMLALAACYGHERAVEEISVNTWKAWARRHMPEWTKGDEADAKALLAYFIAVRAPKIEAA